MRALACEGSTGNTHTAHRYTKVVMQLQRLSGTQTYQHTYTEAYMSTLVWTHRDIQAEEHFETLGSSFSV